MKGKITISRSLGTVLITSSFRDVVETLFGWPECENPDNFKTQIEGEEWAVEVIE